MSVFEAARLVGARDAARRAGIRFGAGGRAFCPFHDDRRHPALSFKGNGYRCFACGATGDAVTLYARLYGVSRLDAARRLSDDFNLGLSDRPPTPGERRAWAQKRAAEARRAADERAALALLCDAERWLRAPVPAPACWADISPAHRGLLGRRAEIAGVLEAGQMPEWAWKVVLDVGRYYGAVLGAGGDPRGAAGR